MLIKSVLSEKPCVKPRKGMIVVVTGSCWGHVFTLNQIIKILEITDTPKVYYRYSIHAQGIYPAHCSQWLKIDSVRQADSSERRIYRKQLKQR